MPQKDIYKEMYSDPNLVDFCPPLADYGIVETEHLVPNWRYMPLENVFVQLSYLLSAIASETQTPR